MAGKAPKKPAAKKPAGKAADYFGKAEKETAALMKKHGVKTLAELEKVLYRDKK